MITGIPSIWRRGMNRKILPSILIFVALWFSLFGVSELSSESEKVLARVGGKVITQRDLDELMKRYESFRKGNPVDPDEKKKFLSLLISSTLISLEAEKEKLDQKPDIQSNLKIHRIELLTREYVNTKIEPLVAVKNEEIEEILKKNPNLIPKESLTLKEILVRTEKEAEEIYQELKKGGDFSKIATDKSISPTKTKGGLLGTLSRGQLPPQVEQVAFQLKEREFSKPVKTEEGFKLFYLEKREQMPQEKMKMLEGKLREKIIQLEKNKKREALIQTKIEELKKEIKVEIYFDQLK
jgi:peptidyl-prolyl cis-trans isomerase C